MVIQHNDMCTHDEVRITSERHAKGSCPIVTSSRYHGYVRYKTRRMTLLYQRYQVRIRQRVSRIPTVKRLNLYSSERLNIILKRSFNGYHIIKFQMNYMFIL